MCRKYIRISASDCIKKVMLREKISNFHKVLPACVKNGAGFVLIQVILISALISPVSGSVQTDRSLRSNAVNVESIHCSSLRVKTAANAENNPTEDFLSPVLDDGDWKVSVNGEWRERNDCFFYYEDGKKAKGLWKINDRFFFFDRKGIQRSGWQKYNEDYYFFRIANGKKGYMLKSERINGITLAKDGKAVLSKESRAKLNILIKANEIVNQAAKPAMEKYEKLRKSFEYLVSHYKYRGELTFYKTEHWEQDYALSMFTEGHGNCYAYGAAFAFLANAVGCKECYAVSSGGHGWAEVDGKVYDPSWSLTDRRHDYFGISFDLSGVDGRPNYKRARLYVVKI